ncbi:efflux RND transporter periplasmic adaptor subunit [Luteitalea sp.]|uniref:efflux RND transporter periplasmic adaptor subunit n=1 Tax=Luteitalea sp. TaxID=2004800 RepID=UPI0025C6C15D|nr:efflux RND transporter periplasmic adaptor subunit [Luteitalea sp.]
MTRPIVLLFTISAFAVAAGACRRSAPANTTTGTAVGGAGVTATSDDVVFAPDSPQLKRITLQSVQTARVPVDVINAPGKIEADPNRIAKVAVPAAGRVARVFVRVGDAVKQGMPLLALQSPEVDTTISVLRQASARLGQARAAQAKAEADRTRVHDLFENQAIAQKDVLVADAAAAQANADVESAQASVAEGRRKLAIYGVDPEASEGVLTLRAPVAGKVLEMTGVAGEYRSDTADPLLTIADLGEVFVTADVPETQIRLVTVGSPLSVTLAAFPDETFQAKVARIGESVDPQTRTVRVRASLANPDGRLRPEMFGRVRYTANFRDLPVVPPAAIVHGEDRITVFVESAPGRFRAVPVEIGTRHGDLVPVLRGLDPSSRVVVDGAMLLVRR